MSKALKFKIMLNEARLNERFMFNRINLMDFMLNRLTENCFHDSIKIFEWNYIKVL